MKIRYQNGNAVEAVTLSRTDQSMRVVLPGSDDVLELTRLSGTWVTDDCEPVSVEYSAHRASNPMVSEEDCICSSELASHLIHLLLNDSSEDSPEGPAPAAERKSLAAARLA